MKRLRDLAREAVGVAPAPTPEDALIAAQRAVADATAVLDGLYDSGAGRAEISDAEAALQAADRELARARLKAESAARVSAKAAADESLAKQEAARAALTGALDARAKAAERIDTLAADLATEAAAFDRAKTALLDAHRMGVAAAGPTLTSAALVRNAIEKAGAAPSRWLGDKSMQPTAVSLATSERGAIIQN